MAKKGSFSKVYDKNGDYADVEAVRFDGTRTVQIQGDVTASQTWNGDSSSPLTLNASIGAKKVTQDKIGDKAVGTGQMADGSVGLTQIADSAMTDTVSANNSKLVTSQGVNAAIAAATLNRGKDYGPLSVDEINAISETIPTGSTVYVESLGASDAKVINDGYSDGTMASFSVEVGEDLKYYRAPDNSLHGWYSTEANVKIKQPANYSGGIAVDSAQDASSGSAGIEFIQSFKQDTNGNIRDIVKAQVDIVDSTSSTRTNAAATPNSVKSAYDLANGKYSKPSGGIPKSDLASGVQTSIDKADSAVQGVNLAGASSALMPDENNVVTVPNAVPTGTGETNGLMTAADKAKLDGIASGAEVNVQSDWNQTNNSADDFIKNKPTDLSDFTDDITQSNYIASGTGSDKPASGAAVAQAVAKSYVATVFSGSSTKSYKAIEFDMAGNTAANCLLGIIEVNIGGSTCQCMFDINAVYTVSSHTVGTVVSELCWIKNKTNNVKLAYSIDTTTDKLIIYVKNLSAWHSAQIRVLTAQVEGRNSLGYVTMFDGESVTLPDSAVEFTKLDSRDASWITSGTIPDSHIASASTWNAKVTGPSSATADDIAVFDGATGKLVKDGGKKISDLAPLESPALTGTPTAPTAARGTNTTQLATTAFVQGELGKKKCIVYRGGAPTTSNQYKVAEITMRSLSSSHIEEYVFDCAYSRYHNVSATSRLLLTVLANENTLTASVSNLKNVVYYSTVTSLDWVFKAYTDSQTGKLTLYAERIGGTYTTIDISLEKANSESADLSGLVTLFSLTEGTIPEDAVPETTLLSTYAGGARGSASVPVHVDALGELKACTDTFVNNIEYVAAQSGGGGSLNKTINGTTTAVLTFMNDSEAVAIWADAKTAAANAS